MSLDLLCAESLEEKDAMLDTVVLQDRVLNDLLQFEHIYAAPSYETVIDDNTRTIIIKWMQEVCDDAECGGAVYPLAVNCFDRFICKCEMPKTFLQLVACGCILIATKVRQNSPIHVETLCYYSVDSFTSRQLRTMELLISSTLNWDLSSITAYDFIDLILHRVSWYNEKMLKNIRRYSVILVHLCYREAEFHDLKASIIATAVVIYAIQGCVHLSTNRLEYICSLTKTDPKLITKTASKIDRIIISSTVPLPPPLSVRVADEEARQGH